MRRRPVPGEAPPGVRDPQHVAQPPAATGSVPLSTWAVGIRERALDELENERTCLIVLGVSMVLSAVLSLWLTRGITFHADDFLYFVANRGFHPRILAAPHNGHLIFVPRLIYAVVLAVFGARHYVVIRLVEAFGVVLVSGLFFAIARRRIGAPAALAPSILLLFLGSAWQNSLDPVGIAHVYCIAAGLGALLALERPSRRADALACVLLTVSVATFSVGLAFVVGAAVHVLLRDDRSRRAWIFLVPLALYGAWLVAPRLHTPPFSTSTGAKLSNVLLIPNYAADAVAAAAAAVAGLSYDFTHPATYTIDSQWGVVLAGLAVVGLVLRLRRGGLARTFWVALAVLLSYWVATALVTGTTREPNQDRYVYDAAVLGLLLAAEALAGFRVSRRALLALFAVTVFALGANLALLRAGGGALRADTQSDRAELAAVEIARDRVSPGFVPQGDAKLAFLDGIAGGARPYLLAVDRNGSFAFTLAELRRQPDGVREVADSNLAAALQLRLAPALRAQAGGCLPLGSKGGRFVDLPMHPPGLLLRSATSQAVILRRFAAFPTVRVGQLSPGRFSVLRIPRDGAPDPWHLSASGPLTACALR